MNIEDLGVKFTEFIIAQMGFFPREQSKHDFGVDVQVETSTIDNKGSGRLIALQVKSGMSYISRLTDGTISYPAKQQHIRYWAEHSLPVVLVIYSPEDSKAWWCDLKEYFSQHPAILSADGSKAIHIPPNQEFTVELKSYLHNLAQIPSDRLILNNNSYSLVTVNDISTVQAKRYRADIIVGKNVSRSRVRLTVYEANQALMRRIEHMSDLMESRWGSQQPHLITLFVYQDTDDVANRNWIARTLWRDVNSKAAHLVNWKTNDFTDDVLIDFKDERNYFIWKSHIASITTTKTEYVKHMRHWMKEADVLVAEAEIIFTNYQSKTLDEDQFVRAIEHLSEKYQVVQSNYDSGKSWPAECNDAANFYAGAIGTGGNIFLPFSRIGKGKWEGKRRDYLISSNLKRYKDDRQMLEFELKKMRL
jgi:hypothetical protein